MLKAGCQKIVFPQPMEFERPKYSIPDVDKAGRIVASGADLDSADGSWAVGVLNNWRAAHIWPLHTVTEALRRYAVTVDPDAIAPYRLKRLSTIVYKLKHRKDKITLSQMHDIGACRAIVNSVENVGRIVELCKTDIPGHRLICERAYIDEPKKGSGYRSHHLIFEFQAEQPEFTQYDGLRTEIQVRSRLQHAWATTVETVDVFKKTNLKSGRGLRSWRRFFRLMAGFFAIKEGTAVVPDTPRSLEDLKEKIKQHCQQHETENFLESCRMTMDTRGREVKKPYYQLIIFDTKHIRTWTLSFERHEAEQAFTKLAELEREAPAREQYVVLVSIESLKALREAYPNYWSDVGPFLHELAELTGWEPNQDDVTITPL